MTQKFIGLMSGTSRDSLDGCLVSFEGGFNFLQGETISFDKEYKTSNDQNYVEKHISEKSVELMDLTYDPDAAVLGQSDNILNLVRNYVSKN